MKLKIVVVDFEIPPVVRKWLLRGGIPGLGLAVATVAFAAPLHVWGSGDTLTASDLNGNFSNLQNQVSALRGSVVWQDSTGAVVPVVGSQIVRDFYRVDGTSVENMPWVQVQGPDGLIWHAQPAVGKAEAYYGRYAYIYYSEAGCTGTAYVPAHFPGLVFITKGDTTMLVTPPDAQPGSVSYKSVRGLECVGNTGTTVDGVVPRSIATPAKPIVAPTNSLFSPPLRPVVVQ